MKKVLFTLLMGLFCAMAWAYEPEFSTAGFFKIAGAGRDVYSMNPAWRFYKGIPKGDPSQVNYNDKNWMVVSLPNGIEYLPTDASGCVNYQGPVWYRKHFVLADSLKGKKLFLYFEAIMGKSKVYINGKLVTEHYGGYLPVVMDATKYLKVGKPNVIAVMADNSDDPNYPPGKPQDMLDFAYFGGIFRDCWLVSCNKVYITDPNLENTVAGGGLFYANEMVSDSTATMAVSLQLKNDQGSNFVGKVVFDLVDKTGKTVASITDPLTLDKGSLKTVRGQFHVTKPHLWAPWNPYLYQLYVRVYDSKGKVVDGYRQRVGIRSIEFKGKDGFYLNGKPYPHPLIGANRHQDYAVVGNAVSNSAHWRDAKKLKDLGLEVIRNAHCPQDPAFMDACDELGLLVIVNTPGWQFWNKKSIFEQRVFSDIRNMVRRDRNHACVWLWEPILNETWYPADFAKKAHDLILEEFPYPFVYSACDTEAKGAEYFNVKFCHPMDMKKRDPKVTYFTREWGDNVDDWSAHNSPSRVARNWGEVPMLVQANHYANPPYKYTCYDELYKQFHLSPQHIGGALWHSFDHQRGYHPDPFYGGLMDVFRQPKYSYYMFMAQRPPYKNPHLIADSGPMIYVANDMDPFSPKDVTVFSNCDEVRLQYTAEGDTLVYHKDKNRIGMPSPIIVFHNVWDFMKDKALTRAKKKKDVYILAQGLMNGKVVCQEKVYPARRAQQIRLRLDNDGTKLHADGSDFVTVIAEITDDQGNVKRLNNEYIKFSISGEGRILGDASVMDNPVPVRWGSAPILVQATTHPGKIHITASVLFPGSQKPVSGQLDIESYPASEPLVYDPKEAKLHTLVEPMGDPRLKHLDIKEQQKRSKENAEKLKVVEKQQTEFGEKDKKH